MDTQRAIAVLIAICAAILIIVAGKSCKDGLDNNNGKKSSVVAPNISIQYGTGVKDNDDENEATAGNAPATAPPDGQVPTFVYTTDEDGNIIIPPEFLTTVPTTTKSMLDEFWDSKKPNYLDPYGNGGYGNG